MKLLVAGKHAITRYSIWNNILRLVHCRCSLYKWVTFCQYLVIIMWINSCVLALLIWLLRSIWLCCSRDLNLAFSGLMKVEQWEGIQPVKKLGVDILLLVVIWLEFCMSWSFSWHRNHLRCLMLPQNSEWFDILMSVYQGCHEYWAFSKYC